MSLAHIRAIMKQVVNKLTCEHVFESIERVGHVVTLECPFCGRRKVRVD
ncbi:hypothetical protein ACGFIV_00825 [Sphaerisporangium sp. NPDC049003]